MSSKSPPYHLGMRADTCRVELWFKLVCLVPLAATLLVILDAAIARVVLGRPPIPNIDDPGHLSIAFIHDLSAVFVLSTYAMLAFLIAVPMKNRHVLRAEPAYWAWIGVFAAGMFSGAIVPAQVWAWWWD